MLLSHAVSYAETCANLGAKKITLLGGEPSLYDYPNKWKKLGQLLEELPRFGFKTVRLDTNGQFDYDFLDFLDGRSVTDLSFSLDGGSSEQNDLLRGQGTFKTAFENISKAAKRFHVSVTICVGRQNSRTTIDDTLKLMDEGVTSFNFHPLLQVGNMQDAYIKDSHLSDGAWASVYQQLAAHALMYPEVEWRIPPRLSGITVKGDKSYCSIRSRDRLHIQPNGQIRICPLSVGGSYRTCMPKDGKITMASPHQSEIEKLSDDKICAFQKTDKHDTERLCVSFKPPLEP